MIWYGRCKLYTLNIMSTYCFVDSSKYYYKSSNTLENKCRLLFVIQIINSWRMEDGSTYRQPGVLNIHWLDDHEDARVLIVVERLQGGGHTQRGQVTLLLLLPLQLLADQELQRVVWLPLVCACYKSFKLNFPDLTKQLLSSLIKPGPTQKISTFL